MQIDTKNKITASDFKLLQANNGYTHNGNHNYFVNDCFKNSDVVLPVHMFDQSSLQDEAKKLKDLCDKVDNMSLSTLASDKDSRRNSDPDVDSNFSATMMKRW